MAISQGKKFESIVKDCLIKTVPDICVDRFYDTMGGFYGIKTPADFIAYWKGILVYLELKSIHGTAFPLKNISEHQMQSLLEKSLHSGVHAGILLWFIDQKKTFYIPIKILNEWIEKKSINVHDIMELMEYDLGIRCIEGNIKRIFFDYNFLPLFEYLKENADY